MLLSDFHGPGRPDDDEMRANFLPRRQPEKSRQLNPTGAFEEFLSSSMTPQSFAARSLLARHRLQDIVIRGRTAFASLELAACVHPHARGPILSMPGLLRERACAVNLAFSILTSVIIRQ